MINHDQSRRNFLKSLGAGSLALTLNPFSCASKKNKPPNILMIIGDDIGYSDIGCYGSEIKTPNLDRLAENGIRFTQFYNMAKCNPTRSTLFTGLYEGNQKSISFVQLLKDAGYYVIWSGKEHFDSWVPKHCYAAPTSHQSLTFWATTEYFIPPSGEFTRPLFLQGKRVKPTDVKAVTKPFYKTDVFTDYALDWLDEPLEDDQPFLLLLPYHVAHYPLQARDEDIQKYRSKYRKGWDTIRNERHARMKEMGIIGDSHQLSPPSGNTHKFRGRPEGDDKKRDQFASYRPWETLSEQEKDENDLEMAVFAGMIDRMDSNIGRVIEKLKKTDQLDNTLILFFTDNGSCPFDSNRDFTIPPGGADSFRCLSAAWANAGNTPFRFFKQFGHEGGSHTHCIMHWPETIEKGQITHQIGHVVDIFPTLLEAAGINYPMDYKGVPTIPLHGQSLLPVLKGKIREEPEFFISGWTDRFRMFRQGDWKIVKYNAGDWELYDMKADPTELDNLSSDQPARVESMNKKYQKIMSGFKDQ